MDIRIIINALIIIFILHIIILNVNYTFDIGNKKIKENFDNNDKKEDSMSFLKETNAPSDEDFKKKLMKYIEEPKEHKKTEFEEKNLNKVEASNTYVSSDNVPNFESNVADISKFFKINYDNLDENDLKATSIDTLKSVNLEKNNSNNINLEQYKDIDSNIDSNKDLKEQSEKSIHFGRDSQVNPDTWSYKAELPMNGGNMNGIFGFDSLESQFATFNSNKLNLQNSDSNNFKNVAHNDLRKPVVYEN
jgi:hypothetical protein